MSSRVIVLGGDPACGVSAGGLDLGRAEGHRAVAVAALAVANRAVDRVSLAAPLEQIHRTSRESASTVARLAVGLRFGAFDHALIGQLVVELKRGICGCRSCGDCGDR